MTSKITAVDHPFEDAASTRLGQFFGPAGDKHPGLSGFGLLSHGREAFIVRLALADLAERSLDMQYYSWDGDITGRIILDSVMKAADRGVRVRLLVDDPFYKSSDSVKAALDAHPGVDIRLFNPLTNRIWSALDFIVDFGRVNRRMHNKLMVADNAAAIVGGRNIGDIYYGVNTIANYRDLDVLAVGPVVRDLSAVFDRFWNSRSAVPIAAIVNRALAKSPADRYQTAHEIVRDLQHPGGIAERAVAAALPAPPTSVLRNRRSRIIAIAAIAAAIVIAAVTYFLHRRHAPAATTATTANVPAPITAGTLAVLLPTVADAKDNKLATFGRGLAESLAQRLSDLSVNHDIAVLTARQLEDHKVTTPAQASKELGATSTLALTLTRDGDLVHAAYAVSQPGKSSGEWRVLASGTVTAPVSDMFSIENQLATATATALNIPLRTDEQRALAAHGTTFPEAYQNFLQGRGYLLEAFTPETFKSAQTMFKEALRIDPNYGAAKAGLGETWLYAYNNHHQPADIGHARGACSDAVALGNAGADGHICLGTLAQETGNQTDAVSEFQKALQLEPANDRASIGLAKAYEKLNQPEKAEAAYKQAIALRPNYWRGYDQLGGFYFRTADYPKAEQMFRIATEKDPQSFRSYSNLAAALSFQAKDSEAVDALKRSIALHPTGDAYLNLGVALFKLRRFDEAAEDFRRSIQFAPDDYSRWSALADAEYYGGHRVQGTGDYKKAVELATEQLKASPNDATILGDLANAYSMIGDSSNALDFLNRSLAINHTDKELMFTAANVYNQLHQTGPALEWLGKALAAGYSPSVVSNSPALDNLHSNSRYQQLIQSAQHHH